MTCVVDLFDLCPEHNVCHHELVPITTYGDEWFPTAVGTSTPSLIRRIVTRITTLTTTASPQGTDQEHTTMDFDFEAAALTRAYIEAHEILDGKVPTYVPADR